MTGSFEIKLFEYKIVIIHHKKDAFSLILRYHIYLDVY